MRPLSVAFSPWTIVVASLPTGETLMLRTQNQLSRSPSLLRSVQPLAALAPLVPRTLALTTRGERPRFVTYTARGLPRTRLPSFFVIVVSE